MQVTKKVTISEVLKGSDVGDNIPMGWLIGFVDRIKKQNPGVRDDEIRVRGAAGIYAEWQHTLSTEEELAARLHEMYGKADKIKALLPGEGEVMTADQVYLLRQILA
jgi:hypothetical protein